MIRPPKTDKTGQRQAKVKPHGKVKGKKGKVKKEHPDGWNQATRHSPQGRATKVQVCNTELFSSRKLKKHGSTCVCMISASGTYILLIIYLRNPERERERERHRNAGTRPESYFSVPIIQYCTRLGTVNFPPHLGLSGWCISCGGANLIGRDSQDNFSGDTADN